MKNKFFGSFFGLIIGDSLGTTNEFRSPEYCKNNPIKTIIGEGKFRLLPGQFTDDSTLALCICESLIENKKLIPLDLLKRFHSWYEGFSF
jgi:ADP-ribosyl-[dinitrogen reductase] hydrolase